MLGNDFAGLESQHRHAARLRVFPRSGHTKEIRDMVGEPGPFHRTPVSATVVTIGTEAVLAGFRIGKAVEEMAQLGFVARLLAEDDVLELHIVGIHFHHLIEIAEIPQPHFCPVEIHVETS